MFSHASMYGVGMDGPIDGDVLTASTTSHMPEKKKNLSYYKLFFFLFFLKIIHINIIYI